MSSERFRLGAIIGALVLLHGSGAAFAQDEIELGKQVFTEIAQPGCPVCHTLADAGAEGNIGPDLDMMQPDKDTVLAAVQNGVGVMPSYDGILTPEQMDAVAAYVSSVAGK